MPPTSLHGAVGLDRRVLLHPEALFRRSPPSRPRPVVGGYIFIAVSGMLFVSLGVLASSLARNQAVAGILCFAMLFVLIAGGYFLPDATWLNREAFHPVKTALDYAGSSSITRISRGAWSIPAR